MSAARGSRRCSGSASSAAPLAWAAQLVVGYGLSEARCGAAGAQWGLDLRTWQLAVALAAATSCSRAEAAALVVFRATRGVDEDAPGAGGRLPLLRAGGLARQRLFLVIVVLDGVGASTYYAAVWPRIVRYLALVPRALAC